MPSAVQAPYDQIATQWDEVRADFRPRESQYLDVLLENVPLGSKVLDLGCGSGRPNAAYVASRGYQVVGVDRSAALLALAQRYVPAGKWIEADIVTVDLEDRFAGAICWDALFHVERIHHRSIVQNVYRCLSPGGRFVLSSGGSEEDIPAFTDTMFGHTFFYDAYPKDQMIRLVQDAGFQILVAELVDLPDGGRNKGKLGIVASKPIEV